MLKVGPALTHAFWRPWSNSNTRSANCSAPRAAAFRTCVRQSERALVSDPGHWRPYAADESAAQRDLAAFGYSDRVRYYWARPDVREALARLLANLSARRAGAAPPAGLIRDRIRGVIEPYARACGSR